MNNDKRLSDQKLLDEYLHRILNSKVYEVVSSTLLQEAFPLSKELENTIFLKREDQQCVHSFKIRGAYNKMAQLTREEREKGVLAASAGNHAQGVAFSAKKLGCNATIVMPVTTPEIKISSVESYGAKTVLVGDSYSDAASEASRILKENGCAFIPPYDDPDVIAGQGTVAKEILDQHPSKLDAVFVPVGGGGFAAGVAVYIKAVRPEVKVYGVEPEDSNCMFQSIKAKRRIELKGVGLFADGVAVKKPGKLTFDLCRRFLDGVICVKTGEICAAIKDIFLATRTICEPAGALALAGAKHLIDKKKVKGKTYVCIVSGANLSFERVRFVTEQTESGKEREALLECRIEEKMGAFKELINRLGKRNITEFNYRYSDPRHAHVFLGFSVKNHTTTVELITNLKSNGIKCTDLSSNELAKEHIRHLVGGHARGIEHEVIYTIDFPERPGALMEFLEKISNRWNITLFHYRNHGADHCKVLVGLDIPPKAQKEFNAELDKLNYNYKDVSSVPVVRRFLGDPTKKNRSSASTKHTR
ncbi:MAG: threonine ammonia-lyase, biosynthetic [Kiritimatiellae bacterium]|nr:threonine ammonia-lyase, biosynthetic [Kiritimatiellia bacterium]